MYNYMESMKKAIKNHLEENYDNNELMEMLEDDRDELESNLHDNLWIDDSVTGNASGSYTFNRAKAKENVLDNMDLLGEMIQEFCIDAETIGKHFIAEDWEWFDVSIRCYLLGAAISEVLDELEA